VILELLPLNVWDSFLGFLNTMMQPIYWAMSGIITGFHWLFSRFMDPHSGWTWALSIIALTVVIRTLMIPLFVRQINSSRKMQLVAPKAKALQEKYGADRERYGQEVMKLYQEEGVNPAASCLPLLVQMPIFIGLFTVLNNASRGIATGYFFEQDPALVDSLQNATLLGASISGTFLPFTTFGATQWVAAFLIIAMTAVLFVTQLQLMRKNMPPEALEGPLAQQQKMMLYMFPVIYLITGVSIPIGVMIYWLASNLWTLGQQWILIHNNPTPNTPAFIDWEERMRAKGKDPAEILSQRAGKIKPRKGAAAASDPGTVARQGTAPRHLGAADAGVPRRRVPHHRGHGRRRAPARPAPAARQADARQPQAGQAPPRAGRPHEGVTR